MTANTQRTVEYFKRLVSRVVPVIMFLLVSSLLAVIWVRASVWLILPGILVGGVNLFLAHELVARFVRALYDLDTSQEARGFLHRQLFGRLGLKPLIVVTGGKIAPDGDQIILDVGGPGGLVIHQDSAVVLEKNGALTRVLRGPGLENLAAFEKVWDVIDLRPQHWAYSVSAMTQDGIPVAYSVDIGFQVGETDDDIFKAATSTWVRDASRTEPDRLMDWTKRVVIGNMEGTLRSILARYPMDALIIGDDREEIEMALKERLDGAVANLGVKILGLSLGEIRVEDEILQQRIEAWRAEREGAWRREIAKGRAEHVMANAKEQTRKAIRKQILEALSTGPSPDDVDRSLIVQCVRAMRHMARGLDSCCPVNMMETLGEVESRMSATEQKG